jgi:acyl-CoA thioester hydrolase
MSTIHLQDFKFSLPLSIRWNDLDPLNHVNNVYYFEYFQMGRGYYMPTACPKWDWTKHMFVIAHIECDYFKELKLTAAEPTIKLRTSSLGAKSFEIEY